MNNFESQEELQSNQMADEVVVTSSDPVPAELPQNVRNVVIELFKKGCIIKDEHERSFKELYLHRNEISALLRNLNLKLILSEDAGIAYLENLSREDEFSMEMFAGREDSGKNDRDSYLITPRRLTLFDTLIILVIRRYYHERYTNGETTIVMDVDRIMNMLTPYMDLVQSSSTLRSRINGVLKRLAERRLVRLLPGDDNDRLEISPLIRFAVSAEFLQHLTDEYEKLLNKTKNTRSKDKDENGDESVVNYELIQE